MTGKWAVRSQSIGEVLTTDIQGDGLRILVFSTRIDLDPVDLEARITRLADTALDAAGRESLPRPVPRLLHHTMGEVLGLLNELERASGQPASAVAFYGNELEVSFAYIGGQEPTLEGLASPTDAPWIRMTYGDSQESVGGTAVREVSGFSLFARANLDIHLRWACAFGAAEQQGVEVLARWNGVSDVAITMRNLRVQVAGDAAIGPPAAKPESFFSGWFDDLEVEDDYLTPGDAQGESSSPSRTTPGETNPASTPKARATGSWNWPPSFEELEEDEVETETRAEATGSQRNQAPTTPITEYEGVEATDVPAAAGMQEAAATPAPVMSSASEDAADGEWVAVGASSVVDDVPWLEPGTASRASAAPSRKRSFGTYDWATTIDRGSGPSWRGATPWIAGAVVLFAVGVWLGVRNHSPRNVFGEGGTRTASALGYGGQRFTVRVTSDPPGAGIWIDDQPTALRTPSEIDLRPGTHRISVGDAESGLVSYDVQGERGRVALHAPLEGTLQVDGPMADSVLVFVDGELRGRAPLRLAGLAPGMHEVEIAPQGQPPRLQTVRVPARGTARVDARPLDLPPTGILEVRSALADGEGSDVKGAAVFIDGERRGSTPLSLELPRGPHSVRVVNGSEESGIQVIDLPGGNVRYANFTLGGIEPVRIELRGAGSTPPPIVVASIPELSRRDVREMWLHVRTQQGLWQRHPMTLGVGPRGPEGVVPFPQAARSSAGNSWYVSVLGPMGEEYFTEVQGRPASRPAPKPKKRAIPHAVIQPDTSLPVVTETPTP